MTRLAVLTLLVATGCASQPPAAPPPSSACNAAAAQAAIGKPATASVMEEARRAANARMVRMLRPGQVVTLEFNAERLNLEVDAANVVRRASCG